VIIGRIKYLNVFPFYHALAQDTWGPYVEDTPRQLGKMARSGDLDAAPLPIVDCFDLEDLFEPLGPWGIACRGAVGSVLLYSHKPVHQLSHSRILCTAESSTSVVLARQMLEGVGSVDIQFERGDSPDAFDGYLVIGDRALRFDTQNPFKVRTDLCELWFKRTGLPFVFARWVVKKSVPAAQKTLLIEALENSVHTPWPAEIPNRAGLSTAAARAYLNNMMYVLDEDCEMAIKRFRSNIHVPV
jgi:chorismate dehydratase